MLKILSFVLVFDFIIAVCMGFLGLKWFLNSQIAFFCTLLIIFASYKNYKAKINSELHSGKYDDPSDDEIKKNPTLFLTFFSPLKILSYILLIVAMFLLVKFEFFHAIGFIIGVSGVPISLLLGLYLKRV